MSQNNIFRVKKYAESLSFDLLIIWNRLWYVSELHMRICDFIFGFFSKKWKSKFPLGHFDDLKLFPDGPNSLENPRNELFASSRYFKKKISSKNIKFSKSYGPPKLVLFFPSVFWTRVHSLAGGFICELSKSESPF